MFNGSTLPQLVSCRNKQKQNKQEQTNNTDKIMEKVNLHVSLIFLIQGFLDGVTAVHILSPARNVRTHFLMICMTVTAVQVQD